MKKILFSLLLFLSGIVSYAQIYTKVEILDKFDDVIKTEQRKTLVTFTDSTIIVEEKGKKPAVYCILNEVAAGTLGSKDDIVNLVGNVYGFQTAWCVVREDMMEKYHEAYRNFLLDGTDNNLKKVQYFWLFATHRTITTQFTQSYMGELFWVTDENNEDKLGKGVNRIVYSKK